MKLIKIKIPAIFLVLGSLGLCANGLNLLLVFPISFRSHYILGSELGKGLALLGHNVTLVSPFEDKDPPSGYNEIVLDDLAKTFTLKKDNEKFSMFEMEDTSPFVNLMFLTNLGEIIAETFYSHSKVQNLLNSNQKFDAVIVEQFWNEAIKYTANHFNAHLIAFSTVGSNRWVNNLVANPENPSYIPDLTLSFGSDMTFFERMYNIYFGFISDLVLYNIFYPQQDTILHKYFPDAPKLDQIQYNISLVLTNSHESLQSAVPHVPNMIDIGGFHVNPPKKLSKDLQEFMDGAKEGVIYFSLGSNLKPSDMPEEQKKILLKVLGSRKEKILWKWDEDQLKDQPANIMISKWFPQQAILAHPNCKLFISHGGLLSITEAVNLGVPVLAFPIFGDQKMNAARIREKKFGLDLAFSKITERALFRTLDEILSNPLYREKAQESSAIFHDRPMKPIETADYWIRYVVRHGGAPHLRVAGIELPFYKYYMLDAFAVGLFAFVFIGYLIVKLIGLCRFKKEHRKKPNEVKKKRA